MNTLNEKAINIFKAVVAETLLQNTYEERFLYGQLESFWNNCRQFAFGWTDLFSIFKLTRGTTDPVLK